MNMSNILFLLMLALTFVILAVCDYNREVNVIYCQDQGRIIYANYSYFPLGKSYKTKYKCRSKTMEHYKFYRLKKIVDSNK